jgi:hypothetical protein
MATTVLPFPEGHVKRKRARRGMGGAGYLTLSIMEHEQGPVPANVQRIDEPDGPQLPSRSVELLFATIIWATLPDEQKERVLKNVRCLAYHDRPDECARQLHNFLARR